MPDGFLIMDEKDWCELSADQRDWIIYKTLRNLDQRMQTLEKRPLADKCFSFLGGAVGGFAASMGLKMGGHG